MLRNEDFTKSKEFALLLEEGRGTAKGGAREEEEETAEKN